MYLLFPVTSVSVFFFRRRSVMGYEMCLRLAQGPEDCCRRGLKGGRASRAQAGVGGEEHHRGQPRDSDSVSCQMTRNTVGKVFYLTHSMTRIVVYV